MEAERWLLALNTHVFWQTEKMVVICGCRNNDRLTYEVREL